jgi:hypothetical protein
MMVRKPIASANPKTPPPGTGKLHVRQRVLDRLANAGRQQVRTGASMIVI